MIQFWIKDSTTISNVNPTKLLLYTCGDKLGTVGQNFFNNVQPCNLYIEANQKYRNQIERFLRNIFRYNIVLDAIVEKIIDNEG